MKEYKLGFISQLDSFRFFAVLLVILSHWVSGTIVNRIPNGYLGVDFFFVLSGFLISTNLFYAKKSILDENLTTQKALFNFYVRRFLRIFPLYYLVLFFIWHLNKHVFDGHVGWYLFYGSNFLIFLKQSWQESLSHFWSLAVEEQFYLIWPFLIFLIPVRLIKQFLVTTILLSMAYKIIMPLVSESRFNDVLTISAFDAFGLGALLAYQKVYGVHLRLLEVKNLKYMLPVILIGLLLWVNNNSILLALVWPYFSMLLIAKSLTGYKGISGGILNNPVFRYFGKISYGIYVYHNFIPWVIRCLQGKETKYPIAIKPLLIDWHPVTAVLMIFQFCVLIGIATTSWFFFEKPLNNLKRYF